MATELMEPQALVPAIPQSEVLAKFLQEIGEKCGKSLAIFFSQIFVLQFPGDMAAKHYISRKIRKCLGPGGPNKHRASQKTGDFALNPLTISRKLQHVLSAGIRSSQTRSF